MNSLYDIAVVVMLGQETENTFRGWGFRKGKTIEDVKHAVKKARNPKATFGKFEYEVDMLELYLKGILKRKQGTKQEKMEESNMKEVSREEELAQAELSEMCWNGETPFDTQESEVANKAECIQVKNVEELFNTPYSHSNDYTFGYVEELKAYAFAVFYETQNSYFSNASAVESGKHKKLILKPNESYSDEFIVYVMKEPVLSVIVWDSGTPFENPLGKRFVINSEEKTIDEAYLEIDELAPYCYSSQSSK